MRFSCSCLSHIPSYTWFWSCSPSRSSCAASVYGRQLSWSPRNHTQTSSACRSLARAIFRFFTRTSSSSYSLGSVPELLFLYTCRLSKLIALYPAGRCWRLSGAAAQPSTRHFSISRAWWYSRLPLKRSLSSGHLSIPGCEEIVGCPFACLMTEKPSSFGSMISGSSKSNRLSQDIPGPPFRQSGGSICPTREVPFYKLMYHFFIFHN